jgi:heptosyltransferase-2
LRTSALGDFLFAIPALAGLRARFPAARIVLLTTSTTNASVGARVANYSGPQKQYPWLELVVPSLIDEAICFSGVDLSALRRDIAPQIRAFDPDLTFILAHPGDPPRGLFKKLVFLKLLGVRGEVLGWKMRSNIGHLRAAQQEAGLFEHHVYGPLRSITGNRWLSNVASLPIEFPVQISEAAKAAVESIWSGRRLSGRTVVAIAPGAVQTHKQWPIEKFLALREALSRIDPSLAYVVVGSPADFALGEKIREQAGAAQIENLCGLTTIPQSTEVLRRCRLLVGNDGGAMHLGAVAGCKVVSIVPGLEYPNSIEPWGNLDLAVRHPVPCAPCYSFMSCPQVHNRCMRDLPVDAVTRNCERALGASARD